MPELNTYLAFLAAVLAMQAIPGPDTMLIIARGVGQGRKIALTCVAGFSAAGLVQIPALALGVASIFQSSPLAYDVLRYAGAAYLIYTGIRFIRSAKQTKTIRNDKLNTAWAAFQQGFWNNLLNPKVLVFMLALLPQFVDPTAGSVGQQLLILGVTMKACGFLVLGTVAMISGTAGRWIRGHQKFLLWQQRLVGSLLLLLGLRLLLDDSTGTTTK